jgi:hypothetical protein
MVRIGQHWEPPQQVPLLITVHALAERLDVSLERAYGLSYAIGRVYYGPAGTRIRVLASRVEEYVALIESGMSVDNAAIALERGDRPTHPPAPPLHETYYYSRRRRRRFY